ncbi:MAG: acyl-CoA thioesterase [Rhodospirillales bacterium]
MALKVETGKGARAGAAAAPRGELVIRTLAMPADTNPNGDIFGGWVLGQMDIAGGTYCFGRAKGRVATVGVESMSFHQPVRVGDVLCCYVELVRVGRTSMTTNIEAWALRRAGGERIRVTEGCFSYVAIDDEGRPRPVPKA